MCSEENFRHREGFEPAAPYSVIIVLESIALDQFHSISILADKLGKREVTDGVELILRECSRTGAVLVEESIAHLESSELISDEMRTSRTEQCVFSLNRFLQHYSHVKIDVIDRIICFLEQFDVLE
ncbi:hypothetical protein PMAYCL1PPCAC_19140 [Pristionchus mayeri]|uniref:Uncharacterized protein n=1 Tax=Pristionchus mayeri TaxID=1317129 RepID=A0AAN5I2C6_9BILA|nr:hypothetical protein PMAYCL1PPCAC_19140 [Pristionchus mayeri]